MKSQKGQSLVEFALVLPVLLLLLLGMADFGITFHKYLTMDHLGREVARAASVHTGPLVDDVRSFAEGKLKDPNNTILLTDDDIAVSFPDGTRNIRIVITQQVNPITPLIGNIIGPINLTNTTEMRLETNFND